MLCLLQGIKRECKALPLIVRQMIVQQVQLEAIKRREAVSPFKLNFKYSICTCALLVASIASKPQLVIQSYSNIEEVWLGALLYSEIRCHACSATLDESVRLCSHWGNKHQLLL